MHRIPVLEFLILLTLLMITGLDSPIAGSVPKPYTRLLIRCKNVKSLYNRF